MMGWHDWRETIIRFLLLQDGDVRVISVAKTDEQMAEALRQQRCGLVNLASPEWRVGYPRATRGSLTSTCRRGDC